MSTYVHTPYRMPRVPIDGQKIETVRSSRSAQGRKTYADTFSPPLYLHLPFVAINQYLEAALQAGAESVELLDMRPIRYGEAAILQAHDLLRWLILSDRSEQLPESSSLLLLRFPAQLYVCRS